MPDSTDILMVLCLSGGTGITAESQTQLGTGDKMLGAWGEWPTKFEAGKYFELESFSLSIQAEPSDSNADTKPTQTVTIVTGSRTSTPTGHKLSRNTTWNPGMLNQVSCSRQIDAASPVMFQDCGKATPYDYAAIVQRKVVGGGIANTDESNYLMSYVRIDFKDVVITNLSWNAQDDGIKETFNIACSKAAVRYVQQLQTGKFNPPTPAGVWQK